MQDTTLKCADCYSKFVFTAGEHQHYISKNLILPKRCKTCRDKKKLNPPKESEILEFFEDTSPWENPDPVVNYRKELRRKHLRGKQHKKNYKDYDYE